MTSEVPGKGTLFVTSVREPLQRPVGTEGKAAYPPKTVMQTLADCIAAHGDKPAVCYQKPGESTFTKLTWNQYAAEIRRTAKAMIAVGVSRFDGVSILGFNCLEWFLANNGAIFAGAIAAGIYTTNAPEACAYVAEHSDSSLVFVENTAQLNKFTSLGKDRMTAVKAYVCWAPDFVTKVEEGSVPVYSWADFIAKGENVEDAALQARMDDQTPGHCCTLIYTSGTISFPKAVMISHDNATWTARVAIESLGVGATDRMVSYLPLSHIAAQMLDLHGPMCSGYSVWFAKPDALRGSLSQTLKDVKPTVFLGVPRVWEKMAEGIKAVGAKNTGLKKKISAWARGKGLNGGYAEQSGKSKPWGYGIADKLVFSKVRSAVGFDECRIMATSAAPIGKDTLEFFLSIGIRVLEIFGMSEVSGPQTLSRADLYATGSCGFAMEGTEMLVLHPDEGGNGELVFKGRNMFMGYLKNDAATAETVDADGYLHSGDVGRKDERGLFYITGRIKELIITSGGENIPPVLIEDMIKAGAPIVSNVMVIGDKRKFLTAIVTLKTKPDANGHPSNDLTQSVIDVISEAGSKATTTTDAMNDAVVIALVQKGVDAANKKAISNAQKVQKFKIIEQDFSLDGGELTPTMKLKRRVVNEKYAQLIDELYQGGDDEAKPQKKEEKKAEAAAPAVAPVASSTEAAAPAAEKQPESSVVAKTEEAPVEHAAAPVAASAAVAASAEESKPVEAAPVAVEETKPVEAAPAAVEETKPVEAAPVAVEETKPVEAAPVAVEETKPAEAAPVASEEAKPVEEAKTDAVQNEDGKVEEKPSEEDNKAAEGGKKKRNKKKKNGGNGGAAAAAEEDKADEAE